MMNYDMIKKKHKSCTSESSKDPPVDGRRTLIIHQLQPVQSNLFVCVIESLILCCCPATLIIQSQSQSCRVTNSIDFICHNFLIILKTYPFHYLTTYTALHYTKKEELVVSLEKSYTQRVYAQQLCTISIRRFPSPARAHHFHLYSFSYFFLKKNYTIFYKFCTRPRQKP